MLAPSSSSSSTKLELLVRIDSIRMSIDTSASCPRAVRGRLTPLRRDERGVPGQMGIFALYLHCRSSLHFWRNRRGLEVAPTSAALWHAALPQPAAMARRSFNLVLDKT